MRDYIYFLLILKFTQGSVDWDQLKIRKVYMKLKPTYNFPHESDLRVVGGQEAKPHQFPYQAGLLMSFSNGDKSFCGGSLISQNYILTAAHCIDGIESVEVMLGAHKIREQEPAQVRMTSKNFTVHEKWSPNLLRNDIALVKLPEPIKLNEFIQTIRLPLKSANSRYTEDMATISGWGKDFDVSNGISPILRFVEVEIENNFRCGFSYPFFIQTSHICTNGREGKSSCNGDSGGPLTIQKDEKPLQIGLVSFGRAAGCEKGYPAVFTRITSFLDWIEKNSDVKIAA